MRVLVGCEFSGIVRDAFRALGHDAWSCDLLPTEQPGPHLTADALSVAYSDPEWDLMIAHPPCTHLAVSGAAWFPAKQADGRQSAALQFVRDLMAAPIPHIAIENPVSIISSEIREPDQIIQPWMFGTETTKATCLWLKNLPPLQPTCVVGKGEVITYASGKRSSKWHHDSFRLPKSERGHFRSKTFPGIASAMAAQWGTMPDPTSLDSLLWHSTSHPGV